MQFEEFIIISIISDLQDIFTIRVKPKKNVYKLCYIPGQFYHIKNPTYALPNVTRPLSVTTTPFQQEYLEFCIKVCGEWSKALIQKKPGESLLLFGPMGIFTPNNINTPLVFIASGIGITPIFSIITSLFLQEFFSDVTLLYANKSPDTTVKRKQIEKMFGEKQTWKYISIYSSLSGRITKQTLITSIDFTKDNTFFVCGSVEFTNQILGLLQELGVERDRIKQEIFLGVT